MYGSEGEGARHGGGLDLGAVATGLMAGLISLVALGLVQGVVGHSNPFSPAAEQVAVYLVQGLSSLLGGVWSARRAEGSGWLHGALTGLMLAAALATVMGVKDAFPEMMQFLQRAGLGTGVGAIGGILGVNLEGRR